MLPDAVLAFAERGADWAAFVDRLPRLTRELCEGWDLASDGAALHGCTAVVLPVIAPTGPAMLKIGFPHEEAEHEHLALQHWRGQAAVRLLRADPGRSAMLLERLDPTDLTGVRDIEACQIVGSLYAALHVPAPPQLRTLTSYVATWTERLAALPRSAPLPRRLVEQAAALGRDFVADPASVGTMVHGDLHYANVLASTRPEGPRWLAIDPKPMSGDAHYEVAALLWNRWDELVESTSGQSVRGGVRDRFHATIDAAGLDEDRARDWTVVRMMHLALWELEDHPVDGLGQPDPDWLTTCVTVAKAVQD